MNIDEKLLDSHKTCTKSITVVLGLTFVLSVYVTQRALAALNLTPDVFGALLNKRLVQINFLGLAFSHQTMTALWPGVLGLVCFAYVLLERKRQLIETSLLTSSEAARSAALVRLDPFHISSLLFQTPAIRGTAKLLALVPLLAILSHISMIIVFVAVLGWDIAFGVRSEIVVDRLRQFVERSQDIGAYSSGFWHSITAAVFSILGLLGALLFRATVRGTLAPVEEPLCALPSIPTAIADTSDPSPPGQFPR